MKSHLDQRGANALDRRLWISLAVNTSVTVVEVVAGLAAGSVALLADAAHNLADAAALGVTILARRLGRRMPTVRYTYGLRRAEVLAALVNAMVLIVIAMLIGCEAVDRFFHPSAVQRPLMVGAALFALIANSTCVFLLKDHENTDINVRSAFLHLLQDAFASLAVIAAALLAPTAIGVYLDPVAAVLIGALVLGGAGRIVREALRTLLEGSPPNLDIRKMVASVEDRFPGVQLHHVHVWEIGPGQRVLTAHIWTGYDRLEHAERIAASIRKYLHSAWDVGHVTLQVETTGCGSNGVVATWD
jgi:cobalt-zinc-cadmium efflux system protein